MTESPASATTEARRSRFVHTRFSPISEKPELEIHFDSGTELPSNSSSPCSVQSRSRGDQQYKKSSSSVFQALSQAFLETEPPLKVVCEAFLDPCEAFCQLERTPTSLPSNHSSQEDPHELTHFRIGCNYVVEEPSSLSSLDDSLELNSQHNNSHVHLIQVDKNNFEINCPSMAEMLWPSAAAGDDYAPLSDAPPSSYGGEGYHPSGPPRAPRPAYNGYGGPPPPPNYNGPPRYGPPMNRPQGNQGAYRGPYYNNRAPQMAPRGPMMGNAGSGTRPYGQGQGHANYGPPPPRGPTPAYGAGGGQWGPSGWPPVEDDVKRYDPLGTGPAYSEYGPPPPSNYGSGGTNPNSTLWMNGPGSGAPSGGGHGFHPNLF
ncbi:hypothetical protein Ciccas_011276 [Cichlidogyrus casuarinus]|uniref:Uncharacterized protein n=1 Tax=Cichlidogyrus casuarinus TaxID=1844966 RepID=A0ABD2PWG0_9PLAT